MSSSTSAAVRSLVLTLSQLHLFEDAHSEAAVKDELEAAKAAGVDLSAYVWLSSAEALAVHLSPRSRLARAQ